MKPLLVLLILGPLVGFSQKTFAPINTVWNYEGKSEWTPSIDACSGNHLQYIVEEELMIGNKDCSLIRAYHSTNLDTLWRYTGDSLVVWEEGDQIYFEQEGDFLLLFDFGAELGDTITRYDPFRRGAFSGTYYTDWHTGSNKMEMIITDISVVDVNGVNLNLKTMSDKDNIDVDSSGDQILSGVGSLSESFSGFYFSSLASGCDGELICHNNGVLNYETPNSFAAAHPSCDYVPFVDNVDDTWKNELSLYPNPFTDRINIEVDLDQFMVRLMDINGKVLISKEDQNVLNVESVIPGIYIMQISTLEASHSMKLIKY